MDNILTNPPSYTEKFSLTIFHIKLLAFSFMLADHIGTALILPHVESNAEAYAVCVALNLIGRFAFPLYLFLIIEGINHTHSASKYAGRILLCAVCSELPFDIALHGRIDLNHQNVMFTLFIGVVAIACTKSLADTKSKNLLYIFLAYTVIPFFAALLAWLMRTDYGAYGIIALYIMYFMNKILKSSGVTFLSGSVVLCFLSPVESIALIGVPLMSCYEGSHGQKIPFVLWYSLYPGHLAILALLRLAI